MKEIEGTVFPYAIVSCTKRKGIKNLRNLIKIISKKIENREKREIKKDKVVLGNDKRIKVGVIGCGYWGPNIIRNFFQLPNCELAAVCDIDEGRLNNQARLYPGLKAESNVEVLLQDPEIDAVALITPAAEHYPLTKKALLAGKHVLVEKPLTLNSDEAMELTKLAEETGRVLMVGHTFEYNPAVHKIKELIDDGALGEVFYVYANRVNLGRYRDDINAFWNIAPHDISILLYVLGEMPDRVVATGASYIKQGNEDVVFATLFFPDDITAYVQASWLDPSKVRKMTLVGSKKMVLYDDVGSEGKIKIYDKGIFVPEQEELYGEYQYKLHSGDITIPKINMSEPLKNECSHFIECCEKGSTPRSDGVSGWRVVRILEAVEESLKNNNKVVHIEPYAG